MILAGHMRLLIRLALRRRMEIGVVDSHIDQSQECRDVVVGTANGNLYLTLWLRFKQHPGRTWVAIQGKTYTADISSFRCFLAAAPCAVVSLPKA